MFVSYFMRLWLTKALACHYYLHYTRRPCICRELNNLYRRLRVPIVRTTSPWTQSTGKPGDQDSRVQAAELQEILLKRRRTYTQDESNKSKRFESPRLDRVRGIWKFEKISSWYWFQTSSVPCFFVLPTSGLQGSRSITDIPIVNSGTSDSCLMILHQLYSIHVYLAPILHASSHLAPGLLHRPMYRLPSSPINKWALLA